MVPSIFGDNLIDSWMNDFDSALFGSRKGNRVTPVRNIMKTDVRETDSSYEMDIDLPGFTKEEVKIRLDNGYLVISAAKEETQENKDEEGKYIRRERYCGQRTRSFHVGGEVKQEDIRARFEDGILKVSIAKPDPEKAEVEKTITIE